MRSVKFSSIAFQQYNDWIENDKDIFSKIKELIKDISRDPFKGIGKPEQLKGNYAGFRSRRITQEHRLIYSITSDTINIVYFPPYKFFPLMGQVMQCEYRS